MNGFRLARTGICRATAGRSSSSHRHAPVPAPQFYAVVPPTQHHCHVMFAHYTNFTKQENRNRRGKTARYGRQQGKIQRRGDKQKYMRLHRDLQPTELLDLKKRANMLLRDFDAEKIDKDEAHRTIMELVMVISRLWSNKKNFVDEDEMHDFVSLSHELVMRLLTMRSIELDAVASGILEKKQKSAPIYNPFKRAVLNTEILCSTVALGWSRCSPKVAPEAPMKAQTVLKTLELIHERRKRISDDQVSYRVDDVKPQVQFYNHILSCWARSNARDAEKHATSLIQRMEELGSSDEALSPDAYSYNNLLNLYAKRGDVSSAEALFSQMQLLDTADVFSYTILQNCLQKRFMSRGRNRDIKGIERAEEVLSQLVSKYESSGFRDSRFRPNNVTFGTVISMYALSDKLLKEDNELMRKTRKWKTEVSENISSHDDVGWGALNAARVLDWVISLSGRENKASKRIRGQDQQGATKKGLEQVCPSSWMFATVMDSLAKAGMGVEGAKRCDELLEQNIDLYKKLGVSELKPNPFSFGVAIDAWAKADDKISSANHAEGLLMRMEELFLPVATNNRREMLSNVPYNIVIDAWSRRSGCAERAEKILRRLIDKHEETNNPYLRPDVRTYTAVMKAFVDDPARNGGDKCLELLDEMGQKNLRPDDRTLAVAMDACVKSGKTRDAERLLRGVDDSKKTRVMFNTLLSGYKREGRGEEAEGLIREMIFLSEERGFGICSPDNVSFGLCIDAWGSSEGHRISRATSLLNEFLERYKAGDEQCKPFVGIFHTTASAITHSDAPNKLKQVVSLFADMEKMGLKASLFAFNIIIKTCSLVGPEEKEDALQVAASTFNSLEAAGTRADSVTYTSMIHAVKNLIDDPEERARALTGIFIQCCEEECLNQHIIDTLSESLNDRDFVTVTGLSLEHGTPRIEDLPTSWRSRATTDQN